MKRLIPLALLLALTPATWGQRSGVLPWDLTPGAPGAGTPTTVPATRAATLPATPRGFREIVTPDYILHTDVSDEEARETDLRLTRIFEEYQRRTADFATAPKDKLPFYLFRREADYKAAGGPAGSDGVYIESSAGKRLMAIAGAHTDDNTWHVIQHEGFHQFVAATIKFDLPIWVNEGLAEYFGEGVWTGDGFVTGLIHQARLEDIRRGIRNGFQPFRQFMSMTDDQWSDNLKVTNYDQAWSMVHFLANADNGRYQKPFLQYMAAISKGVRNDQAWETAFGKDNAAFQTRYAQYWLSLPDRPTEMGFVKVIVQTETSFLARAFILRQNFPDAATFLKKYQPPDFIANRDLWLPPELFTQFAQDAPDIGRWSFRGQSLTLQLADGTTFVGSFTVGNGKVTKVTVDATPGRGR